MNPLEERNVVAICKSDTIKKVFQHFCNQNQIQTGYHSKVNYNVDFHLISEKTKISKYQVFRVFKTLIENEYLIETTNKNHSTQIKFCIIYCFHIRI